MWRWTRTISLRARIVVSFLLLLLTIQAISLVLIRISVDRNARASIAGDLAVGEQALQNLLHQRGARLSDAARLLAAEESFRSALQRADASAVKEALIQLGELNHAAVVAWLDGRLSLQASNRDDMSDLAQQALRLLQVTDREGAGIVRVVGSDALQFVLVPLKVSAGGAARGGYLLVGLAIDQRLADDLRSISGLHFGLLTRSGSDDTWLHRVGTLPSTLAWPMASRLGTDLPGTTLYAADEELSVRSLALANDGDGQALALLMRSVDAAVTPFQDLLRHLVVLGVLGAVAFALCGLFAARRLFTPIVKLTVAAEELGRGDYTVPLQGTDRRDEIGELARGFESMRQSIALHQAEIMRLAYWDKLTGLPNRLQFHDAVQKAIQAAQVTGDSLAVLIVDLDRFKQVNDVLGFHVGDRLLKAVGERLSRHTVREGDLVARLSGDQFAVLLPGADAAGAAVIASRVVHSFNEPLVLDDHTVDVAAGIGIACCPTHGAEADLLMSRAEVAMYAAKRSTEGPQLYNPAVDSASAQSLSLLSDLRRAVAQGELRLYLQPKAALADGRVIGAEALLRWHHPTRGLLPPALFIPFAEQTGFVRELTLWIFDAAAACWEELCTRGGLALRISINLSTRDLHDPELPDKLSAILRRHGVPAEAFCLEITESAIMDDPRCAENTLHALNAGGFKLSIDDFGTGYSSLAYLKRLPVDELKIDRSFVIGMATDQDDAKIVRSTVDLAHNLGLSVVAEGVENATVWRQLRALGCDEAQGYYMTRPLPAAQFADWCMRWQDNSVTSWAALDA